MTYSPQNKTVFTAAYSGALGGIGAALKTPTDPMPTDPGVVSVADVAGAFAQSFDTVWGAVVPSELDVLSIEEVSAAYFIGSAPPNAPPFNVPANWTGVCEALVAIVKAGENYFASQGITPNPWGGGSTGGIVQTTFVWKPGATPGGNVYSSWTALMAAAAGVPGVKFMTIDPTAPGFVNFTVDPGTWNLDEFRISLADDASSNVLRSIIFPDNAFFTALTLYCDSGVLLVSENTISSVCKIPSGQSTLWESIAGGLNSSGGSANPIFQVESGGLLTSRLLANAQLFSAVPLIQTDAGATTTIRFTGGIGGGTLSLGADTLSGGGTINVHLDSGTAFSPTQPSATGALSFFWDPIVNQVQSGAITGSGTHTVSATSTAISRQKSGQVQVSGYCSGATAAPDTITANLVRDIAGSATVIATQTVTTTAGQLNYNVCIATIVDVLPDLASHTYSVRLTGSQNNTVATNQAVCSANEL